MLIQNFANWILLCLCHIEKKKVSACALLRFSHLLWGCGDCDLGGFCVSLPWKNNFILETIWSDLNPLLAADSGGDGVPECVGSNLSDLSAFSTLNPSQMTDRISEAFSCKINTQFDNAQNKLCQLKKIKREMLGEALIKHCRKATPPHQSLWCIYLWRLLHIRNDKWLWKGSLFFTYWRICGEYMGSIFALSTFCSGHVSKCIRVTVVANHAANVADLMGSHQFL